MANPSNTITVSDPSSGQDFEIKLTNMFLQWGGNVEVTIIKNPGAENEKRVVAGRRRKSVDFNGVTETDEDITALIAKSEYFQTLIPELLQDIAKEYTE